MLCIRWFSRRRPVGRRFLCGKVRTGEEETEVGKVSLEETAITACITRSFCEDFLADLELDVAVAGAGPSGITAARYLARKLVRTGWRKGGDAALPQCPYGTVTCYDPAPHAHCEL